MGGAVPLGYDAVNRKLRINAEEAKTVRLLFELYLKLGSVRLLQEECQRLGLRTKLRTMLDGKQSGGTAFSRGHLYRILSNPIYIGRIPHKGRSYEGEHEAIVDAETWDKVQAQLAINAGRKRGRASSKHPSLLAGVLFTPEGIPFTPSHAVNHGRRYRYYVERPLLIAEEHERASGALQLNDSGNGVRTKGWRIPAHEIEHLVLKQVGAFLRDRGAVLDALRLKRKSPDLVSGLLARAFTLADGCESSSFASHLGIVAAIVRRATLAEDRVTIEIDRKGLAEHLLDQKASSPSEKDRPPISIEVPVRFRRRGVEAKLVVLSRHPAASEPDTNLIKALARAHEWWGSIARGEARGIGDIARAKGFNRAYVTRFLSLAFLAPEITKAILEGRQPTELTAKQLIRSALRIPLLWADQPILSEHGRLPTESYVPR
jgi:site-specific DNA recombinase